MPCACSRWTRSCSLETAQPGQSAGFYMGFSMSIYILKKTGFVHCPWPSSLAFSLLGKDRGAGWVARGEGAEIAFLWSFV